VALKRYREALNFLTEYAIDQRYNIKFALESNPMNRVAIFSFPQQARC